MTRTSQLEQRPPEDVTVVTGARSGIPITIVIDSTEAGPALGGCRIKHYPAWRDGLDDAVRLAAAMSEKVALAGLDHGGGKTVAVLPDDRPLPAGRRLDLLHDIGDAVQHHGGRYWTGPDIGTSPDDMVAIGTRTPHVFCRPRHLGGSGDSSGPTALGTMAALDLLRSRALDGRDWTALSVTVVGLGRVGGRVATALARLGARLTVTDLDPGTEVLAAELGARWCPPEEALDVDADVLVPAATGGLLTPSTVGRLRCHVVAGPANNQLDHPSTAELLHRRGVLWAPDTVVSAGGVIHAISTELHGLPPDDVRERVLGIGPRLDEILTVARQRDLSPAAAAREVAGERRARTATTG